MPPILAIHLAIPVIVCGTQRDLFSVNNHLDSAVGYLLGLTEVGCALSLLYGTATRIAAAVLAIVWLAGCLVCSLPPMLENAHVLGFAIFFFCTGRGPLSLDRLLLPRLEPPEPILQYAMPALRIGLGISLTVVAFTEKLANLPMALTFLQRYPVNFTASMGMPLSDQTFILCAGSTELIIGLLILFNIFPRRFGHSMDSVQPHPLLLQLELN